jgi:hypothetical protein
MFFFFLIQMLCSIIINFTPVFKHSNLKKMFAAYLLRIHILHPLNMTDIRLVDNIGIRWEISFSEKQNSDFHFLEILYILCCERF